MLINNAGIFQDGNHTLETLPEEVFDRTLQTNFIGPVKLTRALLPLIRKGSDARVINISSGLGAMNEMSGGYGSYRLSKAALNAATQVYAAELMSDGIKVNSMCPGWVKTDMGGAGASREVAHGAETAVWLATATDIPNGKFLRDKQVIEW